jgi:hypothetical protein
MKTRIMHCGKEIISWGEEDSELDIHEKAAHCKLCPKIFECKHKERYVEAEKGIAKRREG